MAAPQDQPFVFSAGTVTVTLDHAIKSTLLVLNQASATAASAIVSDLNGNILLSVACPATIGSYPTVPQSPIIWPKTNPLTVTVTGAGAKFFPFYR